MSEEFVSRIERTGPGDLVFFRDAVITYCAAARSRSPFFLSAPKEAEELLTWMGVEFEEGLKSGRTFLDPGRASGQEKASLLPCAQSLPRVSLSEYREAGYLGVTLFASLVRSSYGPEEPDFFPTHLELSIYFEESNIISGKVRWDELYLKQCQSFFFEELTPIELLGEIFGRLPSDFQDRARPFQTTLQGLAFYMSELTQELNLLTGFFENLLSPHNSVPQLSRILPNEAEWDEDTLTSAWENLDSRSKEAIESKLFRGLPQTLEAGSLLFACGRDLLEWRAES